MGCNCGGASKKWYLVTLNNQEKFMINGEPAARMAASSGGSWMELDADSYAQMTNDGIPTK
jgi:hypothetical protein